MGMGATVKERRKARGLSREGLAREVAVSTSTIERLELNDQAPKLATIVRIADVLELPLADLVAASTPAADGDAA